MQVVKAIQALELSLGTRVLMTRQQAELRLHNLEQVVARGKDHVLATVKTSVQFKVGEIFGVGLEKHLMALLAPVEASKDKAVAGTIAAVGKFNDELEQAELEREKKLAESQRVSTEAAQLQAWSDEYVNDATDLKTKFPTLALYLEFKTHDAAGGEQKTLV